MGSISASEWKEYNREFVGLQNHLAEIDLFILLKCEMQENISRIQKRNRSYDESKDVSYLVSLEQKYLQFEKFVKDQLPKCKVVEIDTTCMTPVEVVHKLENYIFNQFVSNSDPKGTSGKFGIKC